MREKEKRSVHAHVTAANINALAPLIREVQEFAHSEYAHFNQMPTHKFGTYLIPQEKGVIVAVCDAYRMLAVHDREGVATEPVKVYFPDGLLDKLNPHVVTLANENGSPFDVTCEPKAGLLHITEGFCIVFPDNAEKYEGSMGTWFNGDHGNFTDGTSFRAEPADVSFLGTKKEVELKSTDFNPYLLTNIFKAADTLGRVVTLDYDSGVLEISGDGLCGYVMPCQRKEPKSDFVKDALLSFREAAKTF